jgi:hypothetical protein
MGSMEIFLEKQGYGESPRLSSEWELSPNYPPPNGAIPPVVLGRVSFFLANWLRFLNDQAAKYLSVMMSFVKAFFNRLKFCTTRPG